MKLHIIYESDGKCNVMSGRKKKTSGNPSFLMFSGGEKTLALLTSAWGITKL
jgi:hypothetical protein